MHVCHLTCAPLCLSIYWCVDVCVGVVSVYVYVHETGNQQAPNWMINYLLLLFFSCNLGLLGRQHIKTM